MFNTYIPIYYDACCISREKPKKMHEWKNFIQELCSKLFQHQLANKAHIFCRCSWNGMFQPSVEAWKYFPWKATSLYWLHALFLANPFQTVLKIQIWKFQLMNHECIFMVFSSMFMHFHYSAVISSVFVLNCCLLRFHWHNLVTYAECLPFSAWLPLYHIRFIRCHTPMKGSNLNEP